MPKARSVSPKKPDSILNDPWFAKHDREVERIVHRLSKKRRVLSPQEQRAFADKDPKTKAAYDRLLFCRDNWIKVQDCVSKVNEAAEGVRSSLEPAERRWAEILKKGGFQGCPI